MNNWTKIFSARIAKVKNPRNSVQFIRRELGSSSPKAVFQALKNNSLFLAGVSPARKPKKFGLLWNIPRLTSHGLEDDLAWFAELFAILSEDIKDFIRKENQFNDAYIIRDYERCLHILSEIELFHGLSLWLISRKAVIIRHINGSEAEDYVNSLISTGDNHSFATWLAFMFAYRTVPNVAPNSYVRGVNIALDRANIDQNFGNFIRYFALNNPPRSMQEAEAIIDCIEAGPTIDKYIAVLDVCQYLASNPDNSINSEKFGETLHTIVSSTNDDRFRQLHSVIIGDDQSLIARLDTKAADAYTKGDYREATKLLVEELSNCPGRTDLYSMLARSAFRADVPFPIEPKVAEIVRQMGAVYRFADESEAATSFLYREQLTGAHRPLAASVRALFNSRSKDPSLANIDAAVEAMNGTQLTPAQLRSLPVRDRKRLMAAALAQNPSSLALALQNEISSFGTAPLSPDIKDRLPPERGDLYEARSLLRLLEFPRAIELLRPLEGSADLKVANDARRELFSAYALNKQMNEALRIVASAYHQSERLHALFNIGEILDSVEKEQFPPFDQISLSICYHIYNRYANIPRPGAQSDAAEEYALSKGVSLPSKIDFSSLGNDQELFPLYLDQVCSMATLDKFIAIEDPDSVDTERLEICRILSERDATNRQRYLDEIREITRKRVVRERFAQVERTKIYVDIDGIKRQAEKTLADSYVRFISSLSDQSIASERVEMMRKVQNIISKVETEGVKLHFPDLPSNDIDIQFDDLFTNLFRLLVSSQEYGLVAYLSTRVRHGTMGNQLRSAYELHYILTQKDGNNYRPDERWADTLGLVFDTRGNWLSERLATFSESIDSAIEDLVRKRVAIWSETVPDGLFTFQSYNYDDIRLQSEITPETPFDAFIDKVVDRFWVVLEDSLVAVRQYIEQPFLDQIYQLTEDLQRDVERELSGVNLSPLSDAIAAARTQMAVNVGTVAGWFTLARDMERPDYEFGIAVEVAIESIRVCHPKLGVSLTRADDVSFECRGRSLESLVYLLFTALDNAIKHCNLGDRAPSISLETEIGDNWLQLKLYNSCSLVSDISASNSKLQDLRQRLENASDVQSLATTEGGSGYAKIIRILRHDLLTKYTLEFGYTSQTEYCVKIGLEARQVVK